VGPLRKKYRGQKTGGGGERQFGPSGGVLPLLTGLMVTRWTRKKEEVREDEGNGGGS